MKRFFGVIIAIGSIATLTGCHMSLVQHNPTTQNVAEIDPQQATPDYWLTQPARASVASESFDKLWEASDEVSRDLLFKIDRRDRRSGILTTEPAISAQWFEPWRRELQTTNDVARSSVATISRTIQFTFAKSDAGYVVTPRVLIERQAIAEKRITGALNRSYFRSQPDGPRGSRELDQGVILPQSYWYAIGRDELLEAKIAEMIQTRIKAG